MGYIRKTQDEFQIHGNYGYGYEEVTAANTRKEAKDYLKNYQENEPQASFKIVTKRHPRLCIWCRNQILPTPTTNCCDAYSDFMVNL